MNINSRLKLLRKQMGISQDEAAQRLGVSLSSYQKYEREKNNTTPSIDVILKLADFYGVTTDYLLGREPQINPIANLSIEVDDSKFVELYSALPDYAKQIFVDTMAKLSQAIMQKPMRKSTTYTCGEPEEIKKSESEQEQNELPKQIATLKVAASDGNPITEIDSGVIDRLRKSPDVDPDEF